MLNQWWYVGKRNKLQRIGKIKRNKKHQKAGKIATNKMEEINPCIL